MCYRLHHNPIYSENSKPQNLNRELLIAFNWIKIREKDGKRKRKKMDQQRRVWTGIGKDGKMIAVRSCGIVILKKDSSGAVSSILLLKQPNRFDLPKGHLE